MVIFGLLMPSAGHGQNLVWKDTVVLAPLKNHGDSGTSPVRLRLTWDAEYTLLSNSLVFLNMEYLKNANFISLLHQLKCHMTVAGDKKFRISNFLTHDLGVQYFFDSITRFQPDENTLDTRVEVVPGENISLSLTSLLSTRLFNSYTWSEDRTGHRIKNPGSSFLTPLLWTFSSGIGLAVPRLGTLSVGLSAGKFTWIMNRRVFSRTDLSVFYGVPREKRFIFEYGLSIRLLVNYNFLDRIQWNCDLLLFRNYGKPVDISVKNLIGFRINKFVKASIQTRLNYEKEVSKRVQVENLISIGFYFTLLQTAP